MIDHKMSAAIFCGGKSRRMGRDKALLPVEENENSTFIGQLIRNLEGFDDLWLSINREESYPDIPVRKISDRYPDAGPMGGLESALTVCRHDILFVTAVDIPYADRELAEELYELFMKRPDLDALLMMDSQGRQQHLLGLYRKKVLPLLTRRLEERRGAESAEKDRNYRMKDFLREIRVEYLPAGAVRLGEKKTQSCNTKEEYMLLKGWPEPTDKASEKQLTVTRYKGIPVLSVTGWSGSGKTTFLEGLLPVLKKRGLRVACLKHDAHHFEVDKEGKDSYRLTRAGADMTGLFSVDRGVWMENRPVEPDQMLRQIHDVDLILLEGGSETSYSKILVYREILGKGMRVRPETCIAVVSDDPVTGAVRQFGFQETAEAAEYIVTCCLPTSE